MEAFSLFTRPQRYIGNEWNVIKKSHQDRIKICLCYPDLYEIGMSNLGLRIIYGLLNQYDDVVCERVFLPSQDYIEFLKKKNEPLSSLETKTALYKFDVVGFNLNYELNFLNFLKVLHLGGIPIESSNRDILVLVGGLPNPEPIASFVDVFFIGEFEEKADIFINILRKYKDKNTRLLALSEIEGFYVPSLYEVSFENNKYIFKKKYKNAIFPINRVYVKDINNSFYPTKWLVPHTQIVHDRAQIEIARGCPNRCKFCQARSIYYPYREKKIDILLKLTEQIYKLSGYENFSFLALSASDFSHIEELIELTIFYFKKFKIGISLPSLRIDDIVDRLYKKLLANKKTSLTLAVEVASDSLREKLGKKIDTRKIFEAASILKSLGIQHIKLYFMFGLPYEAEEDILAIGSFLKRLVDATNIRLNVSINIFVPKPFSFWQSFSMEDVNILEYKRRLIFKNIPRKNIINVNVASPKYSILEAILSRADRDFCKVIKNVFLKNIDIDYLDKNYLFKIFMDAIEDEKIDYIRYLKVTSENFAWSFIKNPCEPNN
ncbi:MAG: radical SAM protein [Candidatus Omnitrophica bacterium]|nr:radical SAM protein [Candidatus Omnitrophota bacterium]